MNIIDLVLKIKETHTPTKFFETENFIKSHEEKIEDSKEKLKYMKEKNWDLFDFIKCKP